MTSLIDDGARSRFEWTEAGALVWAEYVLEEGVLVLPHVEAAPALRGTGAAGRLMAAVLDQARGRGLKVRPRCGYAAPYMRRHPRWNDLIA